MALPAPYPFDHPQADLILRSADKTPVDFRVFKLLLSLSSPFFSVLLTLPQPTSPSPIPGSSLLLSPAPPFQHGTLEDPTLSSPAMIQMSEDSETLHTLLSFCYPISIQPIPYISSLSHLHTVAQAATKFEMDGVLAHLRSSDALLSPRFLESQPVRVFAIACCHGWAEEAHLAARYTLRHPVMPASANRADELERISAGVYQRLQDYHRRCGEAASTRVLRELTVGSDDSDADDSLSEDEDAWVWVRCRFCRTGIPTGYRRWWTDWIRGVAHQLLTRPRAETVRKVDLMQQALAQAESCSFCSSSARDDMETYTQMLSAHVEKAISSVCYSKTIYSGI